ncbi:MAG: DHHA1 domain-containing protein [Fervidicoccaceae archaeon]
MKEKVIIYTHGDLDGIASAGIYLHLLKKISPNAEISVNFVEPSSLGSALTSALPSNSEELRIAIMDLGLNASTIETVVGTLRKLKGRAKMEWFDHHVWNESEISSIAATGVSLYIDRDTCAAGSVARHAFGGLEEGDGMWLLVNAVCAADLWLWSDPLSPLYYRAFGKREKSMKREMLELFSRGIIWSDDLNESVVEYIDLELKGYERGLKRAKIYDLGKIKASVAIKPKGPPNSSLLASLLMSRLETEIAAVVREDGALSLRSREYDVNTIARCLGGGGHRMASGAMLDISIFMKILKILAPPLYRTMLERLAVKRISSCIQR